jgi:hypothetical protein
MAADVSFALILKSTCFEMGSSLQKSKIPLVLSSTANLSSTSFTASVRHGEQNKKAEKRSICSLQGAIALRIATTETLEC